MLAKGETMRQRKLDVQFQIDRLQRRHVELDARALELQKQPFLSVQDHLSLNSLKKEKLAAKDALDVLNRNV